MARPTTFYPMFPPKTSWPCTKHTWNTDRTHRPPCRCRATQWCDGPAILARCVWWIAVVLDHYPRRVMAGITSIARTRPWSARHPTRFITIVIQTTNSLAMTHDYVGHTGRRAPRRRQAFVASQVPGWRSAFILPASASICRSSRSSAPRSLRPRIGTLRSVHEAKPCNY